MSSQKVKLLGREIELECNAFSQILYEDEFHRNFIKDFQNILGADGTDIESSNYIRFVWAFAKTADPKFMGFVDFAKSCQLNEVFALVNFVVDAINHSLGVDEGEDPNQEATVQ